MRGTSLVTFVTAMMLSTTGLGSAVASSSHDDQLLEAARRRDVETVRTLLRAASDVNATQPDGATALHWAAHWNDVAMAALLLDAGARVNQANEYGATPLWLACVNGSAVMVDMLLQRSADPNLALYFGETPLMTAARAGATDVVRSLLARGAKVDAKEAERGQTALMWAAAEGHIDVIDALVKDGANVAETSKSKFTPLMFVARQGSIDAARLLVDRGAAINAQSQSGATALLIAVVRGHVDLAEFLLDNGADPNLSSTGYSALHWAAGTWESSITTDYQFTDGEWGALRGIPARDDKIRLIKALVAHGADVNARTVTEPPRTAYTLIVTMPPLLRKGATPFYLAAQAADAAVMRLLLMLGANPEIRSANNTTPMMIAAGRLRIDYETRIREEDALAAVKAAFEAGNDVNATNDDGETALHAAAIGGLNSVVEFLVANGASLGARTKEGRTPLSLADEGYKYGVLVQRPSTAALLRKLAGN